jgi:acyl-CoA thioesterase
VAVDETGWDDAWNKPDRMLSPGERAARDHHLQTTLWSARQERAGQTHAEQRVPVRDADEIEHHPEDASESMSWGWVIITSLLAFAFLALMVVIMVVFGHARLN